MLVLVVGSPLLTSGSHSGRLIKKTAIFFARVVLPSLREELSISPEHLLIYKRALAIPRLVLIALTRSLLPIVRSNYRELFSHPKAPSELMSYPRYQIVSSSALEAHTPQQHQQT